MSMRAKTAAKPGKPVPAPPGPTPDARGTKAKPTITMPNRDVPDPPAGSPSRRSEPHVKEIGGSGIALWDENLLLRTMWAVRPSKLREGETVEEYRQEVAGCAGIALEAFKPKDAVEAMIASQATALHFAALECARRAMLPEQNADVASRLRKDAANLSRSMVEMAEALDRRRGKGPQVIRVEKMLVAEGGRAVVGSVTTGASAPEPTAATAAPKALERGAPPIAVLDAETAMAGAGEGS